MAREEQALAVDVRLLAQVIGLALPAVWYALAVAPKLSWRETHDALEVAMQMALVGEASLVRRPCNRRTAAQAAHDVQHAAMELILARGQAYFLAHECTR